ncbi:MAG: flagellar hook-length control protein FliK, partial [Leptonema sp. (in: Bacteria)]|nr:flagellar hook-length control protein FliK [Leptonema sp. (in: bacteria)]
SNVIQTTIGGKLQNDKSQSTTTKGKAKIQDTKITHIATDKKNLSVSTNNSNQIQATIDAAISKTDETANLKQSKDKLGLATDKWNIVSAKANRTLTKSDTSNSKSDNNETQFKNDNLFKTDLLRSFDKPATNSEIERGVRQGFQDLIKKANVQIGTEGNASAQIRMNPDHLGFMSVDMKVEQNRVIIKILVDRQDVLEQLKKDIEILRGEFVKTGLQVDSVSLKLREPFETSFNSNSSNSEQAQANNFSSSSDKQEPNQEFNNGESYFESAQSKPVELAKPESKEIEFIPTIGQSHYESQLVMNLHTDTIRSSFRA